MIRNILNRTLKSDPIIINLDEISIIVFLEFLSEITQENGTVIKIVLSYHSKKFISKLVSGFIFDKSFMRKDQLSWHPDTALNLKYFWESDSIDYSFLRAVTQDE